MKSVPPSGSGWVLRLLVVDCGFQIIVFGISQSAIGNRKLAIEGPTRYREVVLTSCHFREGQSKTAALGSSDLLKSRSVKILLLLSIS
jgi:hypothetical protein